MNQDEAWTRLTQIVESIVQETVQIKDSHTDQVDAPISWCCIFAQSGGEYEELVATLATHGDLAKSTHNGPVYVIPPLATAGGELRVIKVRSPDSTRPERGDSDFSISEYDAFKSRYLGTAGFKYIDKDDFEMIELTEEGRGVRVYFSNPPVEMHAGIKEALARAPA